MAPLQQTMNEQTTPTFDDVNEDDEIIGTEMQKFYFKKSIFMTGGTGFLGKVTMDKLLRTCEIENIFLLIRSKKGKDIHSRIEEIFDDPLFDRLKREKPKFRHKIVGISGDCVLPGLGIDPVERALLMRRVNIVFHVAATVRFDEKLKLALGINVCGTKEIMTLCSEMEQLKAFIHVSTAYANCNRQNIDEKFYKPRLSGENALKLAECLDEKMLDAITPEVIKEWPNTYTFTKCLAEDLVRQNCKGLPTAIFRPAIVIPTYKEPVAGWIDNMYGPTGIIVGVGAGLLRVINVNKDLAAQIVPVDMCVNSMLASAWDVANNAYEEPPIYNYVTNDSNPITWDMYTTLGVKHGSKTPLSKSIWFYAFSLTASRTKARILRFFYHILPALVMDLGLFCVGKKPKMLQIYKKVHRFTDVLAYFNNRVWYFSNPNVKELWSKLSKEDQDIFYFNMDNVDWDEFTRNSMLGIRTYLMKDDPKTIPAAYKRMQKLKFLHYTVVYSFTAVCLYFLYWILAKFFDLAMNYNDTATEALGSP